MSPGFRELFWIYCYISYPWRLGSAIALVLIDATAVTGEKANV